MTTNKQTLYSKIWHQHLIRDEGNNSLIYVDRQLIHEVTSPQAFEGLRFAGRKVRNPKNHLAVADHNVPTTWLLCVAIAILLPTELLVLWLLALALLKLSMF